MASYDGLRHVALGRYVSSSSPIHRLDPRAKLVCSALAILAMLLAAAWASNMALLVLVLLLYMAARLPLSHLRAVLRPVLPLLAILGVLQLLFRGASRQGTEDALVWAWGPIVITTGSLIVTLIALVRVANLILLVNLLTSTTTTSALTTGLEWSLRPMDAIGLPGHELALVGTIAFRFLPILGEELESILRAQASRGAGLLAQDRWHPLARARRIATLIVPLFSDALRRADEMGMAMLARCYCGGRGRSHWRDAPMTWREAVAVMLTVLTLVGVLIVQ